MVLCRAYVLVSTAPDAPSASSGIDILKAAVDAASPLPRWPPAAVAGDSLIR